jgi:CubicO group peptidase (beta-lactamase class C family)
MTRFMEFLLNDGFVDGEPLLSAELISEMMSPTEIPGVDVMIPLEPIVDPRAGIVAYGLGWMVHEGFGKRIVEHGGAGRSSATVALIPEENLGVFVVTNASFENDSARLVSALKFAALEHFLGLPKTDWIGVLDPGS